MAKPKQITTIFVSVALIVLLGFAVYANTINGRFILDDYTLIQRNAYIQNPAYAPYLLSQDIAAGSGFKQGYYRPIFMLSLMMDFSLWRLDVRGYHFTTILLHILAALSVYWLITILFGNLFISFSTAVFFMIHPIQTEDVAYITGRSDSMALLFIVLCLIFYIKQHKSNKIVSYILMLLTYILTLLSKENGIILPALLLLYHYVFNKKMRLSRFLPILLITFGYVFLRTQVIKSSLVQIVYLGRVVERLPGFFVAISEYIKMLLFPFNLHTFYSKELFQFSHPQAIIGILITLALLIYAFRTKNTQKLVSFSILWFFLSLLPVSNIYPASQYMAMRYLYMPCIGFFLILCNFLSYGYRFKKTKALTVFFMAAIGFFYAFLTVRLNSNWKDSITYYKWNLKYVSDDPLLYNNLGHAYQSIDKEEEAIEAYKQAIAIDSNHAFSYTNLGNLYFTIGKKEEAIVLYQRAIEINPGLAEAYNNLGVAYLSFKKHKEAIALFMRAIEINPRYAEAYSNLGRAQYSIGRREDTISAYKKAIEINPHYAQAFHDLSAIYFNNKQYKLAIEYCDKAVTLGLSDSLLLESLEAYREQQ